MLVIPYRILRPVNFISNHIKPMDLCQTSDSNRYIGCHGNDLILQIFAQLLAQWTGFHVDPVMLVAKIQKLQPWRAT